MARIHYWTETGTIYGVHPGPFTKHALPDGIAWIDVPETPPLIPWPARDGQPGREQWSRVVAGALVLRADLPPIPPDPDAELAKAIEGATTLAALKAALLGIIGAAKVKGRPA